MVRSVQKLPVTSFRKKEMYVYGERSIRMSEYNNPADSQNISLIKTSLEPAKRVEKRTRFSRGKC